jgi:hypothetical protein
MSNEEKSHVPRSGITPASASWMARMSGKLTPHAAVASRSIKMARERMADWRDFAVSMRAQ